MNSPAPMTTMMSPANSLPAQLTQIGLRALPGQLDDFLTRATKARWSPRQLIEQLVQAEAAERSRRSRVLGMLSSLEVKVLHPT